MSNSIEHEAEQAAITAMCEAGTCDHPECVRDRRDILQLLDDVSVMAPGMWENETGPDGWYAVCNDQGIIAYFGDEADAFRFRLDYINRMMNP